MVSLQYLANTAFCLPPQYIGYQGRLCPGTFSHWPYFTAIVRTTGHDSSGINNHVVAIKFPATSARFNAVRRQLFSVFMFIQVESVRSFPFTPLCFVVVIIVDFWTSSYSKSSLCVSLLPFIALVRPVFPVRPDANNGASLSVSLSLWLRHWPSPATSLPSRSSCLL